MEKSTYLINRESMATEENNLLPSSNGNCTEIDKSDEQNLLIENGNDKISNNNHNNVTVSTSVTTGTDYCSTSENCLEPKNSQSSAGSNDAKTTKDSLNFFNESSEVRNPDNDEDDVLGPLPLKWETAYTERGELYFIDHNTGTSHWLDPRLSKFQKKSLEDCGDNELPYGWEKIEDALYGTYFIDHVNRRTQYENPVLEAKRRLAERQKVYENHPQKLESKRDGEKNNTRSSSSFDLASDNCCSNSPKSTLPYKFTRNPAEMQGEKIITTLLKSSRGLGITIVGGDDNVEEFLQIKSIVPNGPAWLDGQLQTGDILVYVNDTCVLGFTHHEMVNVFQSILPGETVTLEVCRGYPLPFDPNDPNTEVVTTIAVDGISSDPERSRVLMDFNDGNYNFLDMNPTAAVGVDSIGDSKSNTTVSPGSKYHSNISSQLNNYVDSYGDGDFVLLKKPEILSLSIVKGIMGFGFTIADSAHGQKVKKILDRNCCTNLEEGDILLEINNTNVRHMSHCDVVQMLKDCSKTQPTTVKIQRGSYYHSTGNVAALYSLGGFSNSSKVRKNNPLKEAASLFRSKTPTADLYSTQQKEILPIRPKTPIVDTRKTRTTTPSNELNEEVAAATNSLQKCTTLISENNKASIVADAKTINSLQETDYTNNDVPFMDPFPKLVTSLTERLAEASITNDSKHNTYQHSMELGGTASSRHACIGNYENSSSREYFKGGFNSLYGNPNNNSNKNSEFYLPPNTVTAPVPSYHQDSCFCYECQEYQRHKFHHHRQQQKQQQQLFQQCQQNHASNYFQQQPQDHLQNSRMHKRANEVTYDRQRIGGFSPAEGHQLQTNYSGASQHQMWNYIMEHPAASHSPIRRLDGEEYEFFEVTLDRKASGFGFRIVGGTEEGSQVTVGHIVPGGSADSDPRVATGDEIMSIDDVNVVNSSHHKVVSLMGEAALRGHVTMILRRRVHHLGNIKPCKIQYPYDVIVSRQDHEGFGFVIISSSNQYYGSTIGKLIPSSPADRCGKLKVGDRIIAVNRIDIAGMSHGEIVNLIKESGLHVRLTIGCPKEGNPLINQSQSPPDIPSQHQQLSNKQGQIKNVAPSNFDGSQMSQHPQL